jgi:hypothetical protein
MSRKKKEKNKKRTYIPYIVDIGWALICRGNTENCERSDFVSLRNLDRLTSTTRILLVPYTCRGN